MVTLITTDQAKEFISIEEDFLRSEPAFYTLTQDPLFPEWDLVTYYTSRKKNLYRNRDGEGDSWLYIMSNETMPNLLKIGFTNKTPDKRAKQLSRSTGVPLEFKVEYAFKCFNSQQLESEIHRYLLSSRINTNREFFEISLEEAKRVVDTLGQHYL